MRKIGIIILVMSLLCSCGKKNRFAIDMEKENLDLKIERFDRDLMSLDTANLEVGVTEMKMKYGSFFNRFLSNVVMLGDPNSSDIYPILKGFLRDSMIREIYNESQLVFEDISAIEKDVKGAFCYIKHYFPEKKIPRVAMHISGFNQNIVLTEDVLSISIDNYLGADYAPYRGLVYDYQLQNMVPQKVASDLILGYLLTEFGADDSGTLLNCMISRGKILYLQSIVMPQSTDMDLMGYSQQQMDWCMANEQNMWNYLMENKQLYNTTHLVLSKYVNPAPFTSYFTQDSPGQAALWLGYRIVKSYMDSNTDVSLADLMNNKDCQKILELSNYRP